MHLRHFRIRKGTVALPSGGGEEGPSLPTPSILCPAQRWTPRGLLVPDHPEPTGGGAGGGRGCEVTACDCQQQRRERGELVAEAGEGDNSSGASGYQNSLV